MVVISDEDAPIGRCNPESWKISQSSARQGQSLGGFMPRQGADARAA
jgi:hypothetical protein